MRRAVNLTNFMCDCLEICEPPPPGTLRACPGIYLPFTENYVNNLPCFCYWYS
jgi:hypothetical protein